MNDELKLCACGQKHRWGVIRYREGTPLYGPRPAENGCADFRPVEEGDENLPAMTQAQKDELWAATSFLNPQVPTATRMAVAQIEKLGKGKTSMEKIAKQWPAVVGLLISQITDIRGAMVRDDSKFAHLVAHTDEIVEAMRGVVHLEERMETQNHLLGRVLEKVYALEERLTPRIDTETFVDAYAHFGLDVQPPTITDAAQSIDTVETVRIIASASRSLDDEAIVADFDHKS